MARRIGPWITPALLAVEVALVLTGLLSLTDAVVIVVVVELALALAAFTRGRAALRSYRRARTDGRDGWDAAEDGLADLLPRPAARAMLIEVRVWVSLLRWPFHRARGDASFGYGRGLRPLLWGVTALVMVEGGVVDVVLAAVLGDGSPWVWVVLGVHVYALVWLVGLLASLHTEPHHLLGTRLELRDGVFGAVSIPLASITGVVARRRANSGRSGLRVDGSTALLAWGDATARVRLGGAGGPVTVRGTARPEIATLDVTVDEPDAFVRALAPHCTGT
jgi:hypothetical protein